MLGVCHTQRQYRHEMKRVYTITLFFFRKPDMLKTTIKNNQPTLFAIILPGILIAATGVGAGDLATASFAGSQLGLAILWAVVIGSIFKFVLTEGLARWQLVTGQSLLEGLAQSLGPVFAWLFLPYLLLWSFFVGSALMSACGVTLHALFPLFEVVRKPKSCSVL